METLKTLKITTPDGGTARALSDDHPLYMRGDIGPFIRVTAIATSHDAANAYMEQHPGEGLLAHHEPLCFIAKCSDLGGQFQAPGSFASEVTAFARRIDSASPPELRAARAALKELVTNDATARTLRRVAHELNEATKHLIV